MHQPPAHVAAGGGVRCQRHRPARGGVRQNRPVGQLDAIHQRLTRKNIYGVKELIEREIEKIAMGIGLPFIAFKGYTNFKTHIEIKGLLDVPLNTRLYKQIKRKLAVRSFISSMGIVPHESICSIIFKEQPSETLIQTLKTQGFVTLQLPPNPYLK